MVICMQNNVYERACARIYHLCKIQLINMAHTKYKHEMSPIECVNLIHKQFEGQTTEDVLLTKPIFDFTKMLHRI